MPKAQTHDSRKDSYNNSSLDQYKHNDSLEIEDLTGPLDSDDTLPTFQLPGKHICLVNDVVDTKGGLRVERYRRHGYEFLPKDCGYVPPKLSLGGQSNPQENFKSEDSYIRITVDRQGLTAIVMMIDERLWEQRERKAAEQRQLDLRDRAVAGARRDGFTIKEYETDVPDIEMNRR